MPPGIVSIFGGVSVLFLGMVKQEDMVVGESNLIMEAIADPELYIWYIYFGELGSLNDLNFLSCSSIIGSIMSKMFDCSFPEYKINNTFHDYMTYFVEGIYPKLSIFISTYGDPHNEKEVLFLKLIYCVFDWLCF